MSTYYRVSDAALRELTAEQYAALAAGKRADLRLYVVDAPPTPSATQALVDAGVIVGPIEAHKAWGVRDKTAAELANDAGAAELQTEMAAIASLIADVKTQRDVARALWDGYTANQLKAEQWRDRQILLRVAGFFLRRVKQDVQ